MSSRCAQRPEEHDQIERASGIRLLGVWALLLLGCVVFWWIVIYGILIVA